MFFYELSAYGHEESYENIYISEIKYNQGEFEDLVFKSYEKLCYQILDEETDSPCFPNIFFNVEFSIFSDEFDKILEEDYNIIRIKNQTTASIGFSLRYDQDEAKYNQRVNKIMSELDFDMSCRENDCSRIGWEVDEEKNYCKKNCLVTRHKI